MGKHQSKTINELINIVAKLVKAQKKLWQLQQFEFMEKKDITSKKKNVIAYVDGSCNASMKICTYGIVLIFPDKIKKYSGQVLGVPKNVCNSRAAELGATVMALGVAASFGVKKLVLKYDCKAIADTANGKYKKSDILGEWFHNIYLKRREDIKIKLKKVKAHSRDKYNEEADVLARKAMQQLVNKKKAAKKPVAKNINGSQPKEANSLNILTKLPVEEQDSKVDQLMYPLVLRKESLPMVI